MRTSPWASSRVGRRGAAGGGGVLDGVLNGLLDGLLDIRAFWRSCVAARHPACGAYRCSDQEPLADGETIEQAAMTFTPSTAA